MGASVGGAVFGALGIGLLLERNGVGPLVDRIVEGALVDRSTGLDAISPGAEVGAAVELVAFVPTKGQTSNKGSCNSVYKMDVKSESIKESKFLKTLPNRILKCTG